MAAAAAVKQLMTAATDGKTDVVHRLIKSGIDVESRDMRQRTALHLACEQAHLATIRELLKSGAKADPRDNRRLTPLHYATAAGSYDAVRELVDAGASVDSRDDTMRAPLHIASVSSVPIIKELIKNGARVDVADNTSQTPLHIAAAVGKSDCCRELLLSGAPLSKLDGKKRTPLHRAVAGRHFGCIALLSSETVWSMTKLQMSGVSNNSNNAGSRAKASMTFQDKGFVRVSTDANNKTYKMFPIDSKTTILQLARTVATKLKKPDLSNNFQASLVSEGNVQRVAPTDRPLDLMKKLGSVRPWELCRLIYEPPKDPVPGELSDDIADVLGDVSGRSAAAAAAAPPPAAAAAATIAAAAAAAVAAPAVAAPAPAPVPAPGAKPLDEADRKVEEVTDALNDLMTHTSRNPTSPPLSPRGQQGPPAVAAKPAPSNDDSGRWQEESLDNLLSQLNDLSKPGANSAAAPAPPTVTAPADEDQAAPLPKFATNAKAQRLSRNFTSTGRPKTVDEFDALLQQLYDTN